MSSITEATLKSFFDEFIDYMKILGIKIEIINDNDTNVDMILKSFLILRNVNDSFNYIKDEIIKHINSQNVPKLYVCNICGYSNDSPYAYGGHMSKHSKYNIISKRNNAKPLENREYYMRSSKDYIVIN